MKMLICQVDHGIRTVHVWTFSQFADQLLFWFDKTLKLN
jgi:hypothetical protein